MQYLYMHKGHYVRNSLKPNYEIKLCTMEASIKLVVGLVDVSLRVVSLVLSGGAWSGGEEL